MAFLNQSLARYKEYIFLSPHLDDVVLSCGFLLEKLKALNKKATVITCFTKVTSKPYTSLAKDFLNQCGYDRAEKLFQERKMEDIEAMKLLRCKYVHLDFIDAAWRKTKLFTKCKYLHPVIKFIPPLIHIYPSEKQQFSGKISFQDRWLIDCLKNKIMSILPLRDFVIIAPLGIGGHVDHIIVREVAKNLGGTIRFWEDFPYNTDRKPVRKFFHANINKFKLTVELEEEWRKKEELIKIYKSQTKALFPNGKIPIINERYYKKD